MSNATSEPKSPDPIEAAIDACVAEGAQAPTPAEAAKPSVRCLLVRLAMAAAGDPEGPGTAGEAKPEASR